MRTIMLRALIHTATTCGEANGHDVWQGPVQTATPRFGPPRLVYTAMPLLMGTIMLRAAIQTGTTCDEANGHDVWQGLVQTASFRFKARLPAQTVTPLPFQ